MTIQIDKNVPLTTHRRGRARKYPFSSMEVGDSFFVPGKSTLGISGSVSQARKAFGGSYATRTVTENGVSGVRVWRTG